MRVLMSDEPAAGRVVAAGSTRFALLDVLYVFLCSAVTMLPRSRRDLATHQRTRPKGRTDVPNILIIPHPFDLCHSLIPSCDLTIHSEMREKHHGTQPFFVLSQFGECLTQHLNQLL